MPKREIEHHGYCRPNEEQKRIKRPIPRPDWPLASCKVERKDKAGRCDPNTIANDQIFKVGAKDVVPPDFDRIRLSKCDIGDDRALAGGKIPTQAADKKKTCGALACNENEQSQTPSQGGVQQG